MANEKRLLYIYKNGNYYSIIDESVSNHPFNLTWPTDSTTKAFCDAVNADATAIEGAAYLGEVTFSDLPASLINAEVIVQIMSGTGTSGKVIHLILSSGNRAPYRWEYTYWNNGNSLSGWIGFQPELTSSSVNDGSLTEALGFDSNGALKKNDVSSSATANTIALRDSTGQVKVPTTPGANEDAASKQYVDSVASTINEMHYQVVNITTYPTLSDFLATTGVEGYVYLYPIDTSDLTEGYYRYIWENSAWLGLGTTQIDLTPYLRKDANATPTTTNTYDLGGSSYTWKDLYLSGNINVGSDTFIKNDTYNYFEFASTNIVAFQNIRPNSNNSKNLGSSSFKWANAYIAGNLSDGTFSTTIASIYKLIYNYFVSNNSVTELDYELTIVCSKSADTTFTMRSIAGDRRPEYKAEITNSGASAIVLTFTGVTSILTNNDEDVVIIGNTITLSAGVTIEVSIVNGKMVAITF